MAIITLNNNSLSSVTSLPAAISTGKVLQVVQATTSTTFTTTSESFVDLTGMTVNITPSSSSNKVLVSFNVYVGLDNADEIHINLLRGSTIIGNNSNSETIQATLIPDDYRMNTVNYSFLDSPSTTSQTTYKLQCKKNGASAVFCMNDRGYNTSASGTSSKWGNSQITAMEVAS